MNHIIIEKADRVTTITLNRPEVMNAVNAAMHHELQRAFDDFSSDPAQHVCVVTGAGDRAFCAGSDLKAAANDGASMAYPEGGYAGLIERFDCDKPFIAAVNGVALGGGFEIAMACDVVIATETARFGLPEPLVGAVARWRTSSPRTRHRHEARVGPDPNGAPGERRGGTAARFRQRGCRAR